MINLISGVQVEINNFIKFEVKCLALGIQFLSKSESVNMFPEPTFAILFNTGELACLSLNILRRESVKLQFVYHHLHTSYSFNFLS